MCKNKYINDQCCSAETSVHGKVRIYNRHVLLPVGPLGMPANAPGTAVGCHISLILFQSTFSDRPKPF